MHDQLGTRCAQTRFAQFFKRGAVEVAPHDDAEEVEEALGCHVLEKKPES